MIPQTVQEKLKLLPDCPGVYVMRSGGEIIYVGKAVSLKNRVHQYFQQSKNHSPKVLAMVERVDDFDTILCDTELEALLLENNLIKKHRPYYNILLKDDKTYPYIKIDMTQPYPAVRLERRVEKAPASARRQIRYFGPYHGATMVREVLANIGETFPLRTCTRDMTRRWDRPCVRYEIGLCPAPCAGLASPEQYADTVRHVIEFLEGDTAGIIAELTERMKAYSAQMRYEQAGMMLSRIKRIQAMGERQQASSADGENRDAVAVAQEGLDTVAQVMSIRGGRLTASEEYYLENALDEEPAVVLRDFLLRHYESPETLCPEVLLAEPCADMEMTAELLCRVRGAKVRLVVPKRGEKREFALLAAKNAQNNVHKRYERMSRRYERTVGACEELGRALGVKAPRRMECYDISHFQGDQTVGSMVVFINGEPARSEYRMFNIKTVEGIDDFKSMAEVITRRFTRLKNADAAFSGMPDMVLVDGGKGQLSSALEAVEAVGLDAPPPFFGLAKQFEEIYRPHQSDPIILDRQGGALHLVQRLRDEAHRFAITRNRSLRGKKTLHSSLEDIPGVGPARRRALLAQFRSIQAIASADVETLLTVRGMTRPAAEAIYKRYHPDEPIINEESAAQGDITQ